MARIYPKDGKYKLEDPEDTELEGIDEKKYKVFTEDKKLHEARTHEKHKHINWFVSYTITDQDDREVRDVPEYTIKLNRPQADAFELYYYMDGMAYPFQYERSEDQEGKKRIKAKLVVGDPPVGHYP